MNSISKRILQLKQKKIRSSKIRNKTLRALETAKSLHRKSISTVNSIQRRVSKTRSELDEVSNTIQHSLARKESILRLIADAKSRLTYEKNRYLQTKQELLSATDEAKDRLEFTLDTISSQIDEIRNEIKQRNLAVKKVDNIIQEYNTKKSRLSRQIKRALQSKPQFAKIMNESKKNAAKLEKRLPSLIKTEKSIQKNFSRINSVIKEQAKRKKTAQVKLRRIKSRKVAEAKRIQNLARKLAIQMFSAKRKAPKRTKAKRKAPKRTKAKRKASRKRR